MMRLMNWAYRMPLSHESYSWDFNEMTVIERLDDGTPLLGGRILAAAGWSVCVSIQTRF
jgi:hypothetical protein